MKKILSILVLVLTLSFTTEAFASLTFTTNAITGTSASTIDLGAGNALSLQTTGNGAINLGSGLLTSTGSATFSGTVKGLNVYEDAHYNIALGNTALSRTVTGFSNVAVGNYAFYSVAGGNYNSAYGNSSLEYLTSGSFNAAFGMRSGTKSGASPDFLNALTTGSNNTFIGFESGLGSTTQRTNSTAIGYGAYVDADNTVVLGNGSVTEVWAGSTKQAKVLGVNVFENAGLAQYAVGSNSLKRDSTGINLTAFGYDSLVSNTTANDVTAIGFYALKNHATGNNNTAVGSNALTTNTDGIKNVAVGGYAGNAVTVSSSNTLIGAAAGYNTGATFSIANALTTGASNTFVGASAGLGSPTQRTNSTAIGSEAYVDADNTVVLGDENVVNVLAGSTALATVKAGAVQLTTKADPTCGVGTRGQFWFLAGGAGVKDTVNVCAKDAGDSYAWRVVY